MYFKTVSIPTFTTTPAISAARAFFCCSACLARRIARTHRLAETALTARYTIVHGVADSRKNTALHKSSAAQRKRRGAA